MDQKSVRCNQVIHKKEEKASDTQNEDQLHDLNEFLKLSENDPEISVLIRENDPEISVPIRENDQNDIICPRCTNKEKICKGIHGLKIHYAHAHKEFISDLLERSKNSSVDINKLRK